MKKNYVLDANVLLHDRRAIFKFEDNNVIIPISIHVSSRSRRIAKSIPGIFSNKLSISRRKSCPERSQATHGGIYGRAKNHISPADIHPRRI